MNTVTCPRCSGTGTGGNSLLRGMLVAVACPICAGTGCVSVDVARWISDGARHREARVVEGSSIHERAAVLGITPARLSAMENGRADPAMLGELE